MRKTCGDILDNLKGDCYQVSAELFCFFVCAHLLKTYFLYDYTMHKRVACIVFNLRVRY